MRESLPSATHISLFSRLRSEDRSGEAWEQFVERYGSHLYRWSLNRGLQPSDAEDVTQNVLIQIARHINAFQYDPAQSFRGWLRRVTENAIADFYRQCKSRPDRRTGPDSMDILMDHEAQRDLLARMNDAFDMELFEHAVDRVRSRIDQRRWLAWKKCARDQLPGKDVAESLNMPLATVYAARYQVQKLIAEEVAILENGQNPSTK